MEVLVLLVFLTLGLVAGAVLFFAWNVSERAHEHVDRLALLPLSERDVPPSASRPPTRPRAGTVLGSTVAPREARSSDAPSGSAGGAAEGPTG